MANYITLSTLKERGWTDSMIRDYGLEPDKEKPNPHYKCASPMKLYDINRIAHIESESWFQNHYLASLSRRKGAKKAVQTKHNKIMAFVEALPLSLPDWTKEMAFQEAITDYNALWAERGRFDKFIYDYHELDSQTLERLVCNMFRHIYTDYDDVLCHCYGKVGVDSAHKYLQEKINAIVHERYFA